MPILIASLRRPPLVRCVAMLADLVAANADFFSLRLIADERFLRLSERSERLTQRSWQRYGRRMA